MNPDTIFIRHKLSTTPEILETLYNEDLIAVHYNNDDSTDPQHYLTKGEITAANVLKRLHSCLKTGAIVAASYREIKPGMLKVGRIDSTESRIEARRFQDKNRGELTYKVVNLVKTMNINLTQYPVLTGIQPRGGTLTGWQSATRILESILSNKSLPSELASLHPSQLEVLCYEFLRETGRLKHLLMPIGRNMYEIDIFGLTNDGALLVAQVTHATHQRTMDDKSKRLAAFAGKDRRLIYFGPASAHPTDTRLTFISIEEMFDHMMKKDSTLIRSMLKTDWANQTIQSSLKPHA
jgi:hypothetical protein